MDPLSLRLKNLKDRRLRELVERTAERFGWQAAGSSAERGFGLACGCNKGGYVACCVEIEIASFA
jgi:isoquinoline 1-oxidoreductase